MILYLFYAIKGLKDLIFSKVAEMLVFENFASKPLTQH